MTKKEKIEIIQEAAKDALEKLAEIRNLIYEAEDETGYTFSYEIKQNIEEATYVGNTVANVLCDLLDEDSDSYKEMLDEIQDSEE